MDCALQIGDFELVKRLINHLGCLFVDYFEIYKVNVIEWCPAHLFLPILFGIVLPLCIRYLSSLPLRNVLLISSLSCKNSTKIYSGKIH